MRGLFETIILATRRKATAVAAIVAVLIPASIVASFDEEGTAYKTATAVLTFELLQVGCWLFLIPLLGTLDQDRHMFELGDGGLSLLGGFFSMALYTGAHPGQLFPMELLRVGIASSILTRVVFIKSHNDQKSQYKLRQSQAHADDQGS